MTACSGAAHRRRELPARRLVSAPRAMKPRSQPSSVTSVRAISVTAVKAAAPGRRAGGQGQAGLGARESPAPGGGGNPGSAVISARAGASSGSSPSRRRTGAAPSAFVATSSCFMMCGLTLRVGVSAAFERLLAPRAARALEAREELRRAALVPAIVPGAFEQQCGKGSCCFRMKSDSRRSIDILRRVDLRLPGRRRRIPPPQQRVASGTSVHSRRGAHHLPSVAERPVSRRRVARRDPFGGPRLCACPRWLAC